MNENGGFGELGDFETVRQYAMSVCFKGQW